MIARKNTDIAELANKLRKEHPELRITSNKDEIKFEKFSGAVDDTGAKIYGDIDAATKTIIQAKLPNDLEVK